MARTRIIAGKAVIVIEAFDQVSKNLGKIRSNLHQFANTVGNLGETAFRAGFFGSIASGALVTGFVKFDDAMRILRVNLDLFGKSAKQVDSVMKPLEERIRSLAQTTPFSPTQVAGAATELARGGFNPEEISNSLQAVLDLARSTNTELDFAAKFVVRTLSTFRIETTKASEVVSQLVRATRKGTINIDDLEAAMRYSSGTADTLGVSLQKMLALFTILSNRGLVGSIGGTSTNTALSQLVKKAEELKEVGKIELVTGFKDDGKEAIDVIRSLENLFTYAATLNLPEQQALFQDIFNLRGARSVAALRDQIGNVNKLAESIADAKDEARQAAVIVDDGLGGAFRRLVSTVQDVTSKLDKQTETTLIKLTDRIRGVIVAIGELIAANPTIATIAILSPGILLAAGAGMLAFSKALRLAAFAAGGLKGALQPIGQLLAKGTGGQIVALGQLRKSIPKASAGLAASGPIFRPSIDRQAGRIAALQNQRNAALAAQRAVQAEKVLVAAEKLRKSSSGKLADSIRQVTVAQSRNNAAIKENASRIWDQQRAEKNRLRTLAVAAAKAKQADLAQAAIDIAAGKRALARQQIDKLVADRQLIRQNILSNATTKFEVDSLRLREEGLTQEIAIARKRANSIRPIDFQTPKVVVPATRATAQTNKLLASRSVLLSKQNELDKVAKSLVNGKAVVEARYIKQLTKGQDLLISSAKAQQAIVKINKVQGPSLSARIIAGGERIARLGTSGTKGLLSFAKGLLTVANVTRRFVFSFSGVLTLLEATILFGDKIPGVATVLERFGQAFSNAFKAIANIGFRAAPAINLFKAAVDAFAAGKSELGIKALQKGFQNLVNIIKNSLYLAWLRFKQSLGSVFGILRQIGSSILLTFTTVFESIGSIISTLVDGISTKLSSNLRGIGLGGGSFTFEGGVKFVAEIIKEFTKLISGLAIGLATIVEKLGATLDIWTLNFEKMLYRVLPFTSDTNALNPESVIKLSDRDIALLTQQLASLDTKPETAGLRRDGKFRLAFQEGLEKGYIDKRFKELADAYIPTTDANIIRRRQVSDQRLAKLDALRKANIEQINKSFDNIRLPGVNSQIQQTLQRLQQIYNEGGMALTRIQTGLIERIAKPQQFSNFDQNIRQGSPANNPSVIAMREIADALVGSVQSTRQNLLRSGKPIEQKQLEEAQKQTAIQQKIAENQGVLFAP